MNRIETSRNGRLQAAVTAIVIAGGSLAVAVPALAGGTGNSVHNCWGVYYNTDWDQTCGQTYGANETGNYHSDADCNNEPDRTKTVYRTDGDKRTVDGPDCNWGVHGVFTTFYQ